MLSEIKRRNNMAHKHKNENPNPIVQISPPEYFSEDRETVPAWIENHKKGDKVNFSELLASRIVYYPGSALEGSPIHVFNESHAAHLYFYIDYGFGKEEIERAMSERIPLGYHIYDEWEISERDILPHAPRYHLNADDRRRVTELYKSAQVPTRNSFGLLKIYERDESYGEKHGARRFAVLFLGGDAIAVYDAIFGNTIAKPFACIIGNYAFDGSYEGFGRNSLLEKVAGRIERMPKYLVCNKDYGWNGYRMLKTVGGTYNRFVWVKEEK
jgi:hypothetical protein